MGEPSSHSISPVKNVIVFNNDLIDSDNWTAAWAVAVAAKDDPSTEVIWIVEPRKVALGLSITNTQLGKCLKLIKANFPDRGKELKVIVGALLTSRDVESLDGVTDEERSLLRLAVRPEYDPDSDALVHSQLMGLDFLDAVSTWSETPASVFLDIESLSKIQNPVNLHMHHHEELIARSEPEITVYDSIMRENDVEARKSRLRSWYCDCIRNATAKNESSGGGTLAHLDLDSLCSKIQRAKSVQYFGGSSLYLLQRLQDRGLASKIKCYMQAATFNPDIVLFPNQFNIGLNLDATQIVFRQHDKFEDFVVIPSDTTRRVLFAADNLGTKSQILCKRILGFNCHQGASDIVSGRVGVDFLKGKSFPMPDLAALICSFSSRFREIHHLLEPEHASLEQVKPGQYLLQKAESGVNVWELANDLEISDISEFVPSTLDLVGMQGRDVEGRTDGIDDACLIL